MRALYELNQLWHQLSQIPINDLDQIQQPFKQFPAGTHRETIWTWFEDQHPGFSAHDRQQGILEQQHYRRFFTDDTYRHDIHQEAQLYIEASQHFSELPVHVSDLREGAAGYHPVVDAADRAAEAALSYVCSITGDHFDPDHQGNHAMIDTVAEIIRTTTSPTPTLPPQAVQAHQAQLFDRIIDAAVFRGNENDGAAAPDRCLRTAYDVLNVIHTHGWPHAPSEPAIPQAFEAHYDHRFHSQIHERSARAARELFGNSPGDA